MHAYRAVATGALVVALQLIALTGVAHAANGLPSSMSSTGDSITRAYNTGSAFADAPDNSWSTGVNATVKSHYSRILATNTAISGKNFNDAKSGAKMADLAGQMAFVAGRGVEYVTVEMGGNDVCTSSVATMTSVADFGTQFTAAMNAIAPSPKTRVFVASIPDAYQLWSLFKNSSSARFTWAIFGICRSLLANPQSTLAADVARRAQVRQRNTDFNTQLAAICKIYPQCRWDGNAVFGVQLAMSDVSTRDYFHPSLAGQMKLASATWSKVGDFTGTWHN
jgi:lysophospholipase L1-like esterase